MAGLKGQVREPRADPRARRNSQNLATEVSFVGGGEVIDLTGEGYLTVILATASGLENSSGELQIDLDTNPGLVLAAGGIAALVQDVLAIDGSGIKLTFGNGLASSTSTLVIDLAATPGLEFTGGDLQVKIKANGGITRDGDGLSAAAATLTEIGAVLEAAARGDSTQNAVTLSAVTDPGDAPADVDALRDDLVANAIPDLKTRDGELETAIETLAGELNDLLAKLRTSGALGT